MRSVEVQAGGRRLTFTMIEAREWVAAGFARWVGRNRLKLTARCDAKAMLSGMSSVVGGTVVEASSQLWAQTFIRHQFLKRERSTAK